MSHIQNALVLYPNQLFATEHLPEVDVIYVVEEPLFFGTDTQYPLTLHKQKLVLHRASMRRYIEQVLWPAGYNVEYVELHDIRQTADILLRAKKAGAEQVQIFDPTDHVLEARLRKAVSEELEPPFELHVLPSPGFYLRRVEIEEYLGGKSAYDFADFYQWQRERFNILIDKKFKPVGGKWIHEPDTHKKPPAEYVAPGFNSFGNNDYVKEAIKWVEKQFPDNPGSTENFVWPTSHEEANAWLKDFLTHRFADFTTYQDALGSQAIFLHHSGLSVPLNCGLITPSEVVDATLAHAETHDIPMDSLESFVRRVLGWREFIRGLYITKCASMRTTGDTEADASLSTAWWDGSTGLPPVDEVIHKVMQSAYAQPSERQMVIGNTMILCGVKPQAMYGWSMSLLIDAYDWNVVPQIYGMSHFTDLGGMIQKPYIAASNYIRSMSHYAEGEWCNIWDGLFWNYVEKHHESLAKNKRTAAMVKSLQRLDADRRRIITYRAHDFLNSL